MRPVVPKSVARKGGRAESLTGAARAKRCPSYQGDGLHLAPADIR
jgi:hypothetical protein